MINYSNLKKLPEGIVMALTWDLGEEGKVIFKNVEVNKKLDEAIFEPSTK